MATLARPPRRARATRRAGRAASARRATSPTCSTATRCTGPAMVTSWARGDDVDGVGDPLPAGPGVAGDAVAAAARPHRRAEPGRAARSGDRAAPRGARPRRPPGPRVAVRAHPAGAEHVAGARRHRRWPATCTCSCCTRRRRSGTGSRHSRASTAAPRARCCDVGQGRPRDAARHRRERRHAHESVHHGASPTTDTLLHRLQADVHGDVRPPGRPLAGGADARALLAGRRQQRPGALVPRAGPPGRGAARRRSSTCSPTTRRSSPATSS